MSPHLAEQESSDTLYSPSHLLSPLLMLSRSFLRGLSVTQVIFGPQGNTLITSIVAYLAITECC